MAAHRAPNSPIDPRAWLVYDNPLHPSLGTDKHMGPELIDIRYAPYEHPDYPPLVALDFDNAIDWGPVLAKAVELGHAAGALITAAFHPTKQHEIVIK